MLNIVLNEWKDKEYIFFKGYIISQEIYDNDSQDIKRREKIKHYIPYIIIIIYCLLLTYLDIKHFVVFVFCWLCTLEQLRLSLPGLRFCLFNFLYKECLILRISRIRVILI